MSNDFFNSLLNHHFTEQIDDFIQNKLKNRKYINIICSVNIIRDWYNQNITEFNNICDFRKFVKNTE